MWRDISYNLYQFKKKVYRIEWIVAVVARINTWLTVGQLYMQTMRKYQGV